MVQAALLDGLFLDLFSPFDDGGVTPEVGVSGCDVTNALMVTPVVVMIDEGADLVFEIAWQIIVLQQDAVLQRLVPPLNLAPREAVRWLIWGTLYEEDAYSAAQRHCEKHGYNAELVRHSWTTYEGLCSIPDHLGILKAPTKFNFSCVKK